MTGWAASAPVVGREQELSQAGRFARDAVGGRGGLLLVSGEAGIGKTTLVEALLERLEPVGAVHGRCRPGSSVPVRALAEAAVAAVEAGADPADRSLQLLRRPAARLLGWGFRTATPPGRPISIRTRSPSSTPSCSWSR